MAESNILTREVAGQPVGVWAVVVAGGLGIAYFINKQQSGPDFEREPLVDPGVGTGLVPSGSAIQPGGSTDSGDEQEFSNNVQWGQAAKAYLIGQGHNPTTADNAVKKYIGGDPNASLTIQENALIQLVLVAIGAPPEDSPPVGVEDETDEGTEGEFDWQDNLPDRPEGRVRFSIDRHGTVPKGQPLTLTGRVGFGDDTEPTFREKVTISWFDPSRPNKVQTVETPARRDGTFMQRIYDTNPKSGYLEMRYTWNGRLHRDLVRFA